MNPFEAILVLTKERKDHHSYPADIIGKAEQLGTEALERLELGRNYPETSWNDLLPSETED